MLKEALMDDLLKILKGDIVEKLRDAADDLDRGYGYDSMSDLMREASSEIQRLQERVGEAYWEGRTDAGTR